MFAYRRSAENLTCKVQYPGLLGNCIYTGAIDCSCSSFPLSSGKLHRLAFKLPFHCQVQKYTTGNFNCIFTSKKVESMGESNGALSLFVLGSKPQVGKTPQIDMVSNC